MFLWDTILVHYPDLLAFQIKYPDESHLGLLDLPNKINIPASVSRKLLSAEAGESGQRGSRGPRLSPPRRRGAGRGRRLPAGFKAPSASAASLDSAGDWILGLEAAAKFILAQSPRFTEATKAQRSFDLSKDMRTSHCYK